MQVLWFLVCSCWAWQAGVYSWLEPNPPAVQHNSHCNSSLEGAKGSHCFWGTSMSLSPTNKSQPVHTFQRYAISINHLFKRLAVNSSAHTSYLGRSQDTQKTNTPSLPMEYCHTWHICPVKGRTEFKGRWSQSNHTLYKGTGAHGAHIDGVQKTRDRWLLSQSL